MKQNANILIWEAVESADKPKLEMYHKYFELNKEAGVITIYRRKSRAFEGIVKIDSNTWSGIYLGYLSYDKLDAQAIADQLLNKLFESRHLLAQRIFPSYAICSMKPVRWDGKYYLKRQHTSNNFLINYLMYCNIIKEMPNGLLKIKVYGCGWFSHKEAWFAYVDKNSVIAVTDFD